MLRDGIQPPSEQTNPPEHTLHNPPVRPHALSANPDWQVSFESQHPVQLLGPQAVATTGGLHDAKTLSAQSATTARRFMVILQELRARPAREMVLSLPDPHQSGHVQSPFGSDARRFSHSGR